MTTTLIDWGDRPDARQPVKILTRGRDMLLPTLDGTLQHVPAGTEIELDAGTLDQLDPDDFQRLG